ncbi:hypothetical protein CC80DRAFT_554868 [Byssothecium circinans]|uniref:Uncharacterized protein n=1 Tax=Byssothecium circinans TaxID=147558 RepID=A0A6A5TLZ3_9PLEO|nr:hypothetical protein CC80DRAFT_554868 [Byssothecium circinans]
MALSSPNPCRSPDRESEEPADDNVSNTSHESQVATSEEGQHTLSEGTVPQESEADEIMHYSTGMLYSPIPDEDSTLERTENFPFGGPDAAPTTTPQQHLGSSGEDWILTQPLNLGDEKYRKEAVPPAETGAQQLMMDMLESNGIIIIARLSGAVGGATEPCRVFLDSGQKLIYNDATTVILVDGMAIVH